MMLNTEECQDLEFFLDYQRILHFLEVGDSPHEPIRLVDRIPMPDPKDIPEIPGHDFDHSIESDSTLRDGMTGTTVTGQPSSIKAEDLADDDIIIAFIGRTGVGKTSFINAASGKSEGVGEDLVPATRSIELIRYHRPGMNRSIVFMDTPGWDVEDADDKNVLHCISEKLSKRQVKLSGIVYLHRICDTQTALGPIVDRQWYLRLLEVDTQVNIVLVTTMWQECEEQVAKRHLASLSRNFGSALCWRETKHARFDNKAMTAWNILGDYILSNVNDTLRRARQPVLLNDPIFDLLDDEAIIAVMGPPGAGKSTFINTAVGQEGIPEGDTLKSPATGIRAIRCPHPCTGAPVVFVETPGFGDAEKSDRAILEELARWLKRTYRRKLALAGIVYLHRITDNRMAGSPLRTLHLFSKLCGDDAARRVVLATTMWTARLARETGERRERQLRDRYWQPMLALGSATARFAGTHASAWAVVDVILDARRAARPGPVLIQEELVRVRLQLAETEAGRALYEDLQRLVAQQKEALKQLLAVQDQNVPPPEVSEKYEKLSEQLRRTFDELERMKISFARWILSFFFLQRARAKGVEIPVKESYLDHQDAPMLGL